MAGLAAEIPIVVCSFALFLLYHVWFFGIHGTGLLKTKPQAHDLHEDIFHKGSAARIQFADLVCRDNDTIQGIQQNRNGLTGVAFMSATVSILAQKILSNILDLDKQDQMKAFAVRTNILQASDCLASIAHKDSCQQASNNSKETCYFCTLGLQSIVLLMLVVYANNCPQLGIRLLSFAAASRHPHSCSISFAKHSTFLHAVYK
jgi:hypothetical protein